MLEPSDSTAYFVLRPDTLPAKADVHRYLHDSFFEHDAVYATEVSHPVGGYGVAGDPVPDKLRSDDAVTLLLLLCFVVFSFSLARSKHFIGRQLKSFFFAKPDDEPFDETSGELRFQLFLVVVGCLLMALGGYLFVTDRIAETFALTNNFQLIAIFFGAMLAYYILKTMLAAAVNSVFFDGKKNVHYLKSMLFLTAVESVLLFPVVMLLIYFDLSVQNALYFFVFVLIFVKMLTIYKTYVIFFRQKGGVLQTFLYFCTLEATPLLAFGGGMLALVDVLKINF